MSMEATEPINDIPVVIITHHAYERAKERINWKHNVVEKMALKAYTEGIGHNEMKGTLSRYVTKLWHFNKSANNSFRYE